MTLEELQEQFLELKGQYEELSNNYNNIKLDNEEKTQTINNLQTLNQKLFLKVTSAPSEIEQEENNDIEIQEHIGKNVYDILNKKDKEILNTILEGDD